MIDPNDPCFDLEGYPSREELDPFGFSEVATMDPATTTVEEPIRVVLTVPPPPAPPAGAKFWEYRIGNRYDYAAETLAAAVELWLAEGTDCTLSARAENFLGADEGSLLYCCEFDYDAQAWGAWALES